jgi:hypothetical protein
MFIMNLVQFESIGDVSDVMDDSYTFEAVFMEFDMYLCRVAVFSSVVKCD